MTDISSRGTALDAHRFEEWPAGLQALFDGRSLAHKAGLTFSLATVGADALARTTLLSAGELYAPDARTLAFALWPSSRAARRLQAAPRTRASLSFVHEAAFYQVDLMVRALTGDSELALFIASIEAGEAQRVRYARLTGGITFELEEAGKAAVLERWRRQVAQLRRAVTTRSRPGGSGPANA